MMVLRPYCGVCYILLSFLLHPAMFNATDFISSLWIRYLMVYPSYDIELAKDIVPVLASRQYV